MLDSVAHQNLRRFAIWYVLARQHTNEKAPYGAFLFPALDQFRVLANQTFKAPWPDPTPTGETNDDWAHCGSVRASTWLA